MMRRRRVLECLLLSCLAVVAVAAPACSAASQTPARTARASSRLGPRAVSGRLIVGLSEGASGYGGASTAPRLNLLVSGTGARWLREEFLWSRIEPARNKFNFSYYDHYMLLAAQRGLHLVVLLDGTPSWAGATPNTIPTNPAGYARFVAAVVGRYGPHGSFWNAYPTLRGSAIRTIELWNEPYFDQGSAGVWDPGRYDRLVKAATTAGRAVDHSVKFLIEAEMQAHLNGVWTWWVDALYAAMPDLNKYFDGIAVHDYGTNTTTLPPIVAGRPYGGYGHIRRIEDLRRQFLAHGGGHKPFWIMEAGWSTCTQASIDCVSVAKQAADLKTMFRYLRTTWSPWVQGVFVYSYQDGPDYHTVQGGYGLTFYNGAAKPALAFFKQQTPGSA